MKKLFFIFLVILALVGGIVVYQKISSDPRAKETVVQNIRDTVSGVPESIVDIVHPEPRAADGPSATVDTTAPVPERVLLDVPFAPQAPFGVWDARHEEACEETSLIMLHAFLEKQKLTSDQAEREIQRMIDFELAHYGFYEDTTAAQTVTLGRDFYGLKNLEVVYDFSPQDLKQELARGNPVILPAAGQELGNPYYTQPGPPYHMIVAIGYSGNTIVTNDPGTRRGQGYRYPLDVFYEAIHDFPGSKDQIAAGRKAMIVVRPDTAPAP